MKRIIIDIYDDEDSKKDLIKIESEEYNFYYVYDKMGGGMQCNFNGGTDEYNALMKVLCAIENSVRRIEEKKLAIK
jgi:hypothetical protein